MSSSSKDFMTACMVILVTVYAFNILIIFTYSFFTIYGVYDIVMVGESLHKLMKSSKTKMEKNLNWLYAYKKSGAAEERESHMKSSLQLLHVAI